MGNEESSLHQIKAVLAEYRSPLWEILTLELTTLTVLNASVQPPTSRFLWRTLLGCPSIPVWFFNVLLVN
jgi:hypothetical protein